MGQQQLLLIVLGVIIVGIAVVVGINLFNANAEESTKDTCVSEGTNIGAMAQQYYKKPVALGGGGNSFTPPSPAQAFDIPAGLDSTQTASWTFAPTASQIVFTGNPWEYTWNVTTTVTPTSIVSTVSAP
jgi:hypothetical protein